MRARFNDGLERLNDVAEGRAGKRTLRISVANNI